VLQGRNKQGITKNRKVIFQEKSAFGIAIEKRGWPAVRLVGLPADLSVVAFSFPTASATDFAVTSSVALASKEAKTEAFGEGGFEALRVWSSGLVDCSRQK
jgi:hypothetical protein